jgi:peptide/nickel transport system substrate-binding protein
VIITAGTAKEQPCWSEPWTRFPARTGYIFSGTYPSTENFFNTQGFYNYGGYSDPQADKLISASVNSANPNAVKSEAAYLTMQQPGLFQPNADNVYAWKMTLSGPPASFENLTQYYITPEVWYFTK